MRASTPPDAHDNKLIVTYSKSVESDEEKRAMLYHRNNVHLLITVIKRFNEKLR